MIFQGFAGSMKIFTVKSSTYIIAYKIGNVKNPPENNGNFALVKSSPQSYPQKEWTAFLLPRPVVQCRPDTESMPFSYG